MPFDTARAAIRERITQNWPDASIPATWANEGQVLPDADAFVAVDIIAEGPAQIAGYGGGRGDNLMRQYGRVEQHCFVKINQGTTRAWRIADAVAAILQTKRFESGAVAVSCFESGPDGGHGKSDDGNFWRVTAITFFHADYVG